MSDIRLIVRQGPRAGQVFELQQPVHSVGRSKENDIQIDDIKMSRRHASLTRTPAGYVLQDLGSTNGTFVNNRRITAPIAIQPGDVIGFGDTVVIDVQGMAGAAPTPAAYAPSPAAYGPPPAAYAPPPPPPVFEPAPQSHAVRNLAIGCGILLAMIMCVLVIGYLVYQYAPPQVAGPICEALRSLPVLEALCQ